MMHRIIAAALAAGALLAVPTLARAQDLGLIAPGHLIGNGTSANPGEATDTAPSPWLDQALCATNDSVAYRIAGVWGCLGLLGTPHTWTGAQTLASPTFTGTVTGGVTITGANTFTGNTVFTGLTGVSGAAFGLSGNISATAWTTSGVRYKNLGATLTDTTSSGTVATAYSDVWPANTIAASSATTFTNYYGSYHAAPVAGSNVALTNSWALGADSVRFGTSNPFTVTATGVVSIGNGGSLSGTFSGTPTFSGANFIAFSNLAQGNALSVLGVTGNSGANLASIAGTANQVFRINGAGTALAFGSIDLSQAATVGASQLAFANLANLGADNILGNFTGGSAAPIAGALVNCSNALTYSTTTHTFGCNASAGTGTVTSVVAGTGLSGGTITTSGTIALALTNTSLNGNPSNQTTTNTTAGGKMMGLGTTCKITPTYSGRVKITLTGAGAHSVSGDAVAVDGLYYGTGTAPANGDAPSGTNLNTNGLGLTSVNAGNALGFSRSGIATGLSTGVQIWIDLAAHAIGAGTVTLSGLQCDAMEF